MENHQGGEGDERGTRAHQPAQDFESKNRGQGEEHEERCQKPHQDRGGAGPADEAQGIVDGGGKQKDFHHRPPPELDEFQDHAFCCTRMASVTRSAWRVSATS